MNTTAHEVLEEVKLTREVRDMDISWRDFWQTYGLMGLYAAAFTVLEYGLKVKIGPVIYFLATLVVVSRAIQDSQLAMKRRIGTLVELLEKKGVL